MRVVWLPVLALGFVPSESTANQHGRVQQIVAPKRVEVHVPPGRFWMGIEDDTAVAAFEQCNTAFPALTGATGIGPNQVLVDFCGDYRTMLAAMAPREVFVGEYWIDRDEVSVSEYRSCVAAGACDLDPLVAGDERYIKDGWPMVNVTWFEAQDFCRWRDMRLPTEAEWERAARGDNASATWPWGTLEQPRDFNHGQPRNQAMREIERTQTITPVQFLGDPDGSDGNEILSRPGAYVWGEGPFGTRDQAGNVAEWTADAWEFSSKVKGYENLERINPYREPTLFQARVVRGGSWRQPIFIARSNLRDPFNRLYEPKQRFSHVGFRCVRSTTPLNSTPPPRPDSTMPKLP